MQTASFTGFIKALFYIMVFYYIFKFLARLFLPIVMKKVVEKASQGFQQQYQSHSYSNQTTANEDEFVYGASKNSKPRETKKVGEYVDYEEID